jgi:hypothetical protein
MERVKLTSESLSRELRRLLSFWADEQVCELHAAGITVKDRQKKIYEMYHGTKETNNISLTEQLCMGLNQFASIFDIELEPTTSTSSSQNAASKIYVLKQRLVRQSEMRVVAGTSFTKRTLSGSSNNAKGLIAGKSLYNYSQDVAKNVRKALSLFHEYMDTDAEGNPAYPSGKTQDDLDVYVLKGMFKYTHSQLAKQEKDLVLIDTDSAMPASASTSSAVISVADLDDLATDNVENGWWFPGFFCFVAFGPQAPSEYRATRFMITDDLAGKKGVHSRKHNRDKLGQQAQELRDNACPEDKRGVSLKTSKEAAEIAINSQLVEQRGQQNTFLALKTVVDTEMEMYKLLVQTLQIVKDDDVLKKETMEDMKRCRVEVAVAKNNLDVFTRSCKRQKSNSAVVDYLAKTGVGLKVEKEEIQNVSFSSSDSPHSSSEESD